jgi:hypothetical protein
MTGKLFSEKKLAILLHVVVWSVLFILPTYLLYDDTFRDKTFLKEVWFQIIGYAILFYTSYFLLAPQLFFKGKKVAYLIASSVVIIILTLCMWMINPRTSPISPGVEWENRVRKKIAIENNLPGLPPLPPRDKMPRPMKNWPLFNFIFSSCMVTGLSLGLRFSEKMILNEKLRKEAEKAKLNTELAFLKHQINPHFLFNTLNSIYSLALIKSDLTAEAVMKLSDMMRYVIQDVKHETVPLELELEYMTHYVELQKIRLNEQVEVHMTLDGDPKPYQIPPMILVPFIENAFKYGTSTHEPAMIRIDMKIHGGFLAFKVTNQVFTGREKPETFGIGIENTRQRLNLIYPGRHKLELTNNGKVFIVNIEISLA